MSNDQILDHQAWFQGIFGLDVTFDPSPTDDLCHAKFGMDLDTVCSTVSWKTIS